MLYHVLCTLVILHPGQTPFLTSLSRRDNVNNYMFLINEKIYQVENVTRHGTERGLIPAPYTVILQVDRITAINQPVSLHI